MRVAIEVLGGLINPGDNENDPDEDDDDDHTSQDP